MKLKMSVRVLLGMFFIATFLNIAKHFMRFNEYPKRTTSIVVDVAANVSSVTRRQNPIVEYYFNAFLICDENASDCATTTTDDSASVESNVELDLCPDVPPGLGPVGTGDAMINLAAVRKTYAELKPGGIHKGRRCKARQDVAIIVPYSGLKKFIGPFLYHMHPFLMKQQLAYQIFVVEHGARSAPFNRGQLFNAGVSEALRLRPEGWSCLVLHEAGLLPLDLRNLYRCSWYPRQLLAALEHMDKTDVEYKPKGGAIAVTPDQFMKINGFTNTYLERDAFYENFYRRILSANYTLEKTDESVGVYRVLNDMPWNVPAAPESTYSQASSFSVNGYTDLSYKLSNLELLYFYTHVNVTVLAPVDMHQTTTKPTTEFSFDALDSNVLH